MKKKIQVTDPVEYMDMQNILEASQIQGPPNLRPEEAYKQIQGMLDDPSVVEGSNSTFSQLLTRVNTDIMRNPQSDEVTLNLINELSTRVPNSQYLQELSLFLKVLKQYLKACNSDLIFMKNIADHPNASSQQKITSWIILNYMHSSNFKYCLTFKNYSKKYSELQVNNHLLRFLTQSTEEIVAKFLNLPSQKVKIQQVFENEKSPTDSFDITFVVLNDNVQSNLLEIDLEQMTKRIMTFFDMKNLIVKANKQKIVEKVVLSERFFLEKHWRNWNDLQGQVDIRGIKNNVGLEYYFPYSWIGFGIDVSDFTKSRDWLSMDEKSLKSWPVGYLPARTQEVSANSKQSYAKSIDHFGKGLIGPGGITVYRKPQEMEKACDVITEPSTMRRFILGFLCRINIDTLKCPQENKDVFVVFNIEDIRPYRYIVKPVQ